MIHLPQSGRDDNTLGFYSYHALSIAALDESAYHQHNDIELFIATTEPLEALIGGNRVAIPVLRLGVFWGLVPHLALQPAPQAASRGLYVPLLWFLRWNLPPEFSQSLLQGHLLLDPQSQNGEADVSLFERWHEDVQGGDAQSLQIMGLEVEARLRRLAAALHTTTREYSNVSPRQQGEGDLGRVERMASFIAAHYRSGSSVQSIAHAAGLNPKYAMRLFKSTCGVTLLQYLTQHRLWHAQRLLVTSDLTLLEVARESGFGSLPRFHEVFKRERGVSPGQYRMQIHR